MNKKRKLFYFPSLILILLLSSFLFFEEELLSFNNSNIDYLENDIQIKEVKPSSRQEIIEIQSGTSFGQLMSDHGICPNLSHQIYTVSLNEYDLARISAGREIVLNYCFESEKLESLYYQINNDEELLIKKNTKNDTWEAKRQAIDYEVRIESKEAVINSSMYNAAIGNNIDKRAIVALANAFQWTLDFSMDTKKGDEFKFIYEARYLDGEYIRPGRILAAKYINQGNEYRIFYFKESEDNQGYFNEEANSVQRMFLRAPLEYKYISSGYTTGSRYIQAFNISTGHRAIDYAAPAGTPIRAVGDGVITYVGWRGNYGNFISIRHNSTYSTNYAHLSRFAVTNGQRVKQGDIIGYVGSTGLSTGPHLHYEMVKNGIKVNPLTEVLPPGEPIKEENLDRFYQEISKWQKKLD